MNHKNIKLIPPKHYDFLKDFFKNEPAWWDEIKDDYDILRLWAKTLKGLGWYKVDE
jgi:hypothetical protein